jgi:phosphoribosyl-ATP pyrophosphohydrolase
MSSIFCQILNALLNKKKKKRILQMQNQKITVELYSDIIEDLIFEDATLELIADKLVEESNEVYAEVVKSTEPTEDLELELGDTLFCLIALIKRSGYDLSEVMVKNLSKLELRVINGKQKS